MQNTLAKLMAVAALAWACAAHALGLGEIELKSRLNQTLSATILISSATPAELESLNVQLAGNEDFERAGMERAEFLSTLKFEVQGNTIRVSSKDIVREPFVSFLLDVRWGGGRLLREYTVLLDLPTQPVRPAVQPAGPEAQPQAQAESSAPRPTSAPTSGETQVEPASSPPPASSAQPSARPEGRTYGPVQAKETLWSIAYRLRPDPALTMDQVQVAIFEANPQAFEDGRLTGLMKGTVLRMPGADEIAAIDAAAAKAQVARGRDTVSAPAAAPAPAPVAAAPKAAVTPAPALAPEPKPAPAAPVTTPEETAPAATAPAPAEEPAPPLPDTTGPTEPAQSETAPQPATDPSQMVDEPAPAESAAPDAAAEPIQTQPAPAEPAPVESPGLIETLTGNPLFFPIATLLVILLIVAAGWRKIRDRVAQWQYDRASKKAAPTADFRNTDTMAPAAGGAAFLDSAQDDAEAAQPAAPPARFDEPMARTASQTPVAETQAQTFQQTQAQTQGQTPAPTRVQEPAAAHTGAPKVDFDVSGTYATETVQINLEAGDPVSEAEFHRAYGLYDEAALLLKQALQKDPKRTEVRVKLAEIYFEANKTNEFVDVARDLKGQLPETEWQKIALLGSQIAAGNELFQGAGAAGGVDLSFDEPAPAAAPAPAKSAPAQASAAPAADSGLLDFKLEDFKFPDTAQAPAPAPAAAPAAAAPGGGALEFDLDSLSLDTPATAAAAKPTPAAAPAEEQKMALDLGDFDLKMPDPTPAARAPASPGIDLGGDLAIEEVPAGGGDESSTKLDLARAYMDMGDNDMAKSLLNEVQQQGSAQQKKEAQELLQRVAA